MLPAGVRDTAGLSTVHAAVGVAGIGCVLEVSRQATIPAVVLVHDIAYVVAVVLVVV